MQIPSYSATVVALSGAYWIYVDFDYHRRIHWLVSNLIAFLVLIAIVEPLMMSAQSYQARDDQRDV